MCADSIARVATLSRQPYRWLLDVVATDGDSDIAAQFRTWRPLLAIYSRGRGLQLVLRTHARAPAVDVHIVRRGAQAAGHVELLACSLSTRPAADPIAQRPFALTASFAQMLEAALRERTTAYAVAVEVLKAVDDD